jgi:beta-glucosidase
MQKKSNTIAKIGFIILVFSSLVSCESPVKKMTSTQNIEQKVDSLLALMTLEEKIGQMSQVRHFSDINKNSDIASKFIGSVIHTDGPAPGEGAKGWQEKFIALQKQALSTRLGIPLLIAVDAVHGQNTFDGATIFPHNIGMGATQNEHLLEEAAVITALEAQATGFNWVFSPCVAIPYNEKWGRVYEAFSESTELTAKLTKASVKGHQGKLAEPTTVMATAKHFIGDGATDYGKEGGNTTLELQELSDRLLPPYKTAVAQGIGAVMASFNTLSGKAMHAHKALITDTLKKAMQFDGIVVSDWKGYSRFGKTAVVNAGVDMLMTVDGDLDLFQSEMKTAIDSGIVSIERINDAVKRILRQKFRLGLFTHPFPKASLISKIGSKAHRDVARQAVRESLVLLKNNHTLPLAKDTPTIVVVGEHANNTGLQSGGWTLRWQGVQESYKGATTILQGIQNASKGTVLYDKNASEKHSNADVVIVVVGETPYAEFFGDIGDGSGTYQLTLSQKHQDYIDAYKKLGVKVVTVLVSGRPLVVTEQITKSDAFVAAWLLGSEGNGVADVLFGDFDFTGKLPHSWPKSVDDFTGKYGPNFWDTSIQPLYPLGYGLTLKK